MNSSAHECEGTCVHGQGPGRKRDRESHGRGSLSRLRTGMVAAAAVVLFILNTGAAQTAQAQVESVLHSFTGSDGSYPLAHVIRDSSGNLYGTTKGGGTSPNCGGGGCGTVFELSPSTSDGVTTWTEMTLHSFAFSDGAYPMSGLVMDSSGNLYGTTYGGGSSTNCGTDGCGGVFELTKATGYTASVIHDFNGFNSSTSTYDGATPYGGLVMDPNTGNLYGTTSAGGTSNGGTVFELHPPGVAGASWSEAVIYSLSGTDGTQPQAGLLRDSAGNLYGTTSAGGTSNGGTVFRLSPPEISGTPWSFSVLHALTGSDGDRPVAGLVMDSAGNLYGTTFLGGTSFEGTAFELTASSGYSNEIVLYSFGANGPLDAAYPRGGLVVDSSGNLYGTTDSGGALGGGTVFELVHNPSTNSYTEKVLHSFSGFAGLMAGLVIDLPTGNLYGTTVGDGSFGYGTVFGMAPVTLSASSLDFGTVAIGSGNTLTVTVTNIGSNGLQFGPPSFSGTNAADFSAGTDTCSGQTVAANGSCSVNVNFRPSMTGAETAALTLDEGGIPLTVSLAGTGAVITASLTPSNLAFPDQIVGTTSAAQTVTLTNTSTSDVSLTINSVSVSANFSEASTTCGASLAKGESCTIDVAFVPTATGSLTGTLTVADNGGNRSQTVALSGTGVTAAQYVQDVIVAQVEALYSSGVINKGQENSLLNDLNDAINLLNAGNINGAIGNLEDFISHVNSLASSGVLSPTEASLLISEASSVISSLE